MKILKVKVSVCIISILFSIIGTSSISFADCTLPSQVTVEAMGEDIYQMIDDYESGIYKATIEDPNFNAKALFSEPANSYNDLIKEDIYQVKCLDAQDNTYEATCISKYSTRAIGLEREEQAEHKNVYIMVRIVYNTISIPGGGGSSTAYNITTVKGGVVRTTNLHVVSHVKLSSTGNGKAYDASGNRVGIKHEGTSQMITYLPVTGQVYSIPSEINYYYAPDSGGGTGGINECRIIGAHTSYEYLLEASAGWVY